MPAVQRVLRVQCVPCRPRWAGDGAVEPVRHECVEKGMWRYRSGRADTDVN